MSTSLTALYDDVIFARYRGHRASSKSLIIKDYPKLLKHFQDRLQLDFYPGNWRVKLRNDKQFELVTDRQLTGDFVDYQKRDKDVVVSHVDILPDHFILPLQGLNLDSDPQIITITLTKSRRTVRPYDSMTRLVRIFQPVSDLLQIVDVVNAINHMYDHPVFKLRVVLDAGMCNDIITGKQVSYLKTSFNQTFGRVDGELYVTNSQHGLGSLNYALTPYEVHDAKLSASDFSKYLYQDAFSDDEMTKLHLSLLDLSHAGFVKLSYDFKKRPDWLDNVILDNLESSVVSSSASALSSAFVASSSACPLRACDSHDRVIKSSASTSVASSVLSSTMFSVFSSASVSSTASSTSSSPASSVSSSVLIDDAIASSVISSVHARRAAVASSVAAMHASSSASHDVVSRALAKGLIRSNDALTVSSVTSSTSSSTSTLRTVSNTPLHTHSPRSADDSYDYNADVSVSDILRRHMSNKTWSNKVTVTKLRK